MTEFNDKQFAEAHSRANGEGAEYIENLALELAHSFTKAGIKINGQNLFDKLNSIADDEGMEIIKNAVLLRERLRLSQIIEPLNPEDIYRQVLLGAYIRAISMSVGQENITCIENLARELSSVFKKQGKEISEEQIQIQLSKMIKYQMMLDVRKEGYYDPEKSTIKAFIEPEKFLENLCMRLQLAGLLD